MADRHDGGAGQPLLQRAVDRLLRRLVERGRSFVEEQPVGLEHQRARDREALLLAARQDVGPVRLLVEPGGEVAEARRRQRRRRSRASLAVDCSSGYFTASRSVPIGI